MPLIRRQVTDASGADETKGALDGVKETVGGAYDDTKKAANDAVAGITGSGDSTGSNAGGGGAGSSETDWSTSVTQTFRNADGTLAWGPILGGVFGTAILIYLITFLCLYIRAGKRLRCSICGTTYDFKVTPPSACNVRKPSMWRVLATAGKGRYVCNCSKDGAPPRAEGKSTQE